MSVFEYLRRQTYGYIFNFSKIEPTYFTPVIIFGLKYG